MSNTAFLQRPITASPEDWKQWNISDFRGGLNSGQPALSLRDNEFPALSNWLLDEQGNLTCRSGFEPYRITLGSSFSSMTSGTIRDMQMLEKDGKPTLYISETSTDSGTTFKKAVEGETDWIELGKIPDYNDKSSILVYGNNNFEDEFLFPDNEVPKRSVGTGSNRTLEDLGLGVPEKEDTGLFSNGNVELKIKVPEGTEAKSRAGIDISGTYYYKLTFYYDDTKSTKFGESAAMEEEYSASIDITDEDDSKYVEFYGLFKSKGLPDGVVKVNVYRSPAGAKNGPYKWVGSFSQTEIDDQVVNDNESNPVFTDTVAIDAQGSEIPIGFSDPVACYEPVLIRSTVWAFDSLIEGKIIWSNPSQIDVFPALNFAYLDGKGQRIVEFSRNIYIFTSTSIYIVKDGDPSNTPIKVSNLGTSSRQSVCVVGNGVMWLGDDEIYWADFNSFSQEGELPRKVGFNVIDKVKLIPREWLYLAQATYFENRYYLSLPSGGTNKNTETLVFDLRSRGWSRLDWSALRFATTSKIMLSASNTPNSIDFKNYIYEHSELYIKDILRDNGTAIDIPTSLLTKPLLFGDISSSVLINSTTIVYDGRNTDVTFTYSMPEQSPAQKTISMRSVSGKDYLYWAEDANTIGSNWDDTYWFSEESFVSKRHFKVGRNIKGDSLTLGVDMSDAGGTSLIGLSLHYEKLRSLA